MDEVPRELLSKAVAAWFHSANSDSSWAERLLEDALEGILRDLTDVPRALELGLGSMDQTVRLGAVIVLTHWLSRGRQPAEVVHRLLAQACADPAPNVREHAAYWALPKADPDSVTALAPSLMTDDSEGVRAAALAALSSLQRPDVVPRLLEALADPSERIRERAAKELATGADERVLRAFRVLMGDPPPGAAFAIATTLCEHATAEGIRALSPALTHANPSVRWSVARALGAGGAEAVPMLVGALLDEDGDVRAAALHALPKTGEVARRSNSVLAEITRVMLTDGLGYVREAAVKACAALYPTGARDALLHAAADPDPRVREEALCASEKLDPEERRAFLERGLRDSDARVVERAVAIAKTSPDPLLADALVASLVHQGGALFVLAGCGTAPQVSEALLSASSDEQSQLREAAACGMGSAGDARVVRRLRMLLLGDASPKVREQAASSLGVRRAAEAQPDLVRALDDDSAAVRQAARNALQKLG